MRLVIVVKTKLKMKIMKIIMVIVISILYSSSPFGKIHNPDQTHSFLCAWTRGLSFAIRFILIYKRAFSEVLGVSTQKMRR